MKDTVLPVGFIVAALVAGTWYYMSMSAQRDANARAFSVSAAANAAPPAVKKAPPVIRRILKPGPVPEVASDPNPVPVEVAKSAPEPLARRVHMGSLSDIKPGMEADTVIDLLGEPDLTAVTTDRGSLLATYVYGRDFGRRILMIHLRGGRVEFR